MSVSGTPKASRLEIFGWAMFDFANSSYTTVIVTFGFAIYFTHYIVPDPESADATWGLAVAASNLIILIAAPLLGAIADISGRKKFFLFATYAVCVLGTAGLYWAQPGMVALAVGLFIVSNVAFGFGESFAGAFLPELASEEDVGRVSGFAWGLGYLGGMTCLILVKPFLDGMGTGDLDLVRKAWPITAAFFAIAGLPTFLLLKERAHRPQGLSLGDYAREGFGRLAETMRSLKTFRQMAIFLGIFCIYSMGLSAIFAFAGIFPKTTLGYTATELVWLSIILQISAAGGAIGLGFLQDKVGARPMIRGTLLLWVVVSIATALCQTKLQFFLIAFGAGAAIGSLQSASRALVALFAPPEKSAEFFAFWGLAAKAAYVGGPAVFGLVSSVSGSQRIAVAVNGIFFLIGLIAMRWVDVDAGRDVARDWHSGVKQTG